MNGDGRDDLVTYYATQRVAWIVASDAGGLGTEARLISDESPAGEWTAFNRDLDGNGHDDSLGLSPTLLPAGTMLDDLLADPDFLDDLLLGRIPESI